MQTIEGVVNWGIIGAGDVCEKKSGPAFNKVENSRLLAVMRRDLNKIKDYALRHHVPEYTTDAAELINHPEINAIYIATPPAYHAEYAIRAMEAGKAVYIEKPVTLDTGSCMDLIRAAEKYRVPVSVAHYRRCLPIFIKLRDLLREKVIGKVLFIQIQNFQAPVNNLVANSETNWRVEPEISGGGLFHDLAPHQLDLMVWYFGEPEIVNGYSTNLAGLYSAADYTTLQLQFRNEIHLTGTWCFVVHPSADREEGSIIGDKGKITFSFFRSPVLTLQRGQNTETFEFPFPEHIQSPMIDNVVKFFRGESENPCSLEDALMSMRIIDSASRPIT